MNAGNKKNIGLKQILIFLALGVIILIAIWPSRNDNQNYIVNKIIDGNTIMLNNGTTVRLIGVSSTLEGERELKNLTLNQRVELIPDHSNYFEKDKLDENTTIYAYIVLPNQSYECVNALLLKRGKVVLEEDTYLTDSLMAFRKYASDVSSSIIIPTPQQPAPIDYENDDIKLPNYTIPNERKHSYWYTDGDMNTKMIDEACDFNSPYTKAFANQLAAKSPGSYNINQVCEIFDYCYKKWRYINDPIGQEYVASASESIAASLTGDCDDFAVLLASCVIAIGGEASIITAHRHDSGHAYAEVCISSMNLDQVLCTIQERFSHYSIASLNTSQHDGRIWLNLDWQSGYPGGHYWSCKSKDTYTYNPSYNKWEWSNE